MPSSERRPPSIPDVRTVAMTAKRLWLPALLVGALVGAGIWFVLNRQATDDVEAAALIVATDLKIATNEFPATADVIFRSGTVAASAIENGGFDLEPKELIPGRVEVRGVGASVTIQVAGTDPDPQLAAEYANAAADALVEQLNAVGSLGDFALFERAVASRATEKTSLPSLPLAVLGGLFAAVLVPLTAVLVRRPTHSIAALTGMAGDLPIARLRSDQLSLGAVSTIMRRLLPGDAGRWNFRSVGAESLNDASAVLNSAFDVDGPDRERQATPVLLVGAGTPSRQVEEAIAFHRPDALVLVES